MSVGEVWIEAVARLGGDLSTARSTAVELTERYAEPHRKYHRTSHVEAVLSDAHVLASAEGFDYQERAVLDLAVCAHDVVYDAQPGDDERASAAWVRQHLLAAGISKAIVERVGQLVLSTLTHDVAAGDRVAAVLSDADLSILAADPEVYDRYVIAVREEFRAVPDELWTAGRSHVLGQLLAKDRLFATDVGWTRWESPARDNVQRELKHLVG